MLVEAKREMTKAYFVEFVSLNQH